jgi:hypothetical protein
VAWTKDGFSWAEELQGGSRAQGVRRHAGIFGADPQNGGTAVAVFAHGSEE